MWVIDAHDDVGKRTKKLRKTRRRELKNVLDNLDTVLSSLNRGIHPEALKRELSFIHGNYPLGIISIDQSGPTEGKGRLVQLRLYAYPSVHEEVLYLRIVGEKKTQEDDVAKTREYVEGLLKGLQGNADLNEPNEDVENGEEENS